MMLRMMRSRGKKEDDGVEEEEDDVVEDESRAQDREPFTG